VDHVQNIAAKIEIRPEQAWAAINLLDDDNTVPFIARYRKEMTEGLDEDQLRRLKVLLDSLRSVDKRRQTILKSIADQGKLSPELEGLLKKANSQTELDDLYQPYRPKRRTRASEARKRGLQGLADLIVAQIHTRKSLLELTKPFLQNGVSSADDALSGARDITAEIISDHPDVRRRTREKALKWAVLNSSHRSGSEDERGVYQIYYDYHMRVDRLRHHQILAINRGEKEKILRVKVDIPERAWRRAIGTRFLPDQRSPLYGQLELAIEDAARRLLLPAIERDVRREVTEKAEAHAISVFAQNLRGLLTQPPLSGHVVLGIDPGFRTGCKIAVVDSPGKVLDTASIFPHAPRKEWTSAVDILTKLANSHSVSIIAIGNGTASRETELLVAELIKNRMEMTNGIDDIEDRSGQDLRYIIVNEAGASVYSASQLARDEFPDLDVTLRGAVSIARRVQDPLSELVKIDPRSIGVGLYQHDLNQKKLTNALDGIVESVVNQVGVDVNTASATLLSYVSGVGPKLADRIIAIREERGAYRNRQELRLVPGLGPKSYQQAAGFLRIRDGSNPLDESAIHPESYPIAEAVLSNRGLTAETPLALREQTLSSLQDNAAIHRLASELDAGLPTLRDIIEQLIRPGRDPRDDLPLPILRSDVVALEDLRPGMQLKGTVRNVVDFGAFIDIGVKRDGLLHRSQQPSNTSLGVGDVIEITIINVDPDRGRISLGWID
jgi:uncharacterized protein